MKIIRGSPKGFFANCGDVARHISHCINNNEQWYVDWGPETSYFDIKYGPNAWEYYFKQLYKKENNSNIVGEYIDLILLKDNSFRSTMNFMLKNYFILNENIQNIIKSSVEYFDKHNILGVHVRRTDKFLIGLYGTTYNQSPVDLQIFKKEIDKIEKEYDKIFLATDCKDTCDYMKKIYGEKLIFNQNSFRGSGSLSIHNNYKNISGYEKGLQVLCDVILLSKCKYLVRSSSNVSIFALYMNLDLPYLNLNEKYLNDSERIVL